MIIPVRCFTCGKPIGHLWEKYKKSLQDEKKESKTKDIAYLETLITEETIEKKMMDNDGLRRYCCRRMIMSHIDLAQKV
jgi:DNA-directed RNA polymerase subunit N (RpoN/RPB10)